MPQEIKIWEIVEKEKLKEFKKGKLDLEKRIETWIEKDNSLIGNDLLVIGSQVPTDFGGVIDLLCLDSRGDIVIVELKRDETPREITAQVLDYASWVKDLSNEKITEIANEYLKDNGPLEGAFTKQFGGEDLPEVINENHKMLVVASEIDSSSERIIKYLSDYYGVKINALTFQCFDDGKKELLARVFLIDPLKADSDRGGKRKPNLTFEELKEIAVRNGVGQLFQTLTTGSEDIFDQTTTTRSSVAYIGIIEGSRHTIFSILPMERMNKPDLSDNHIRGLRYQLRVEGFLKYFGMTLDELKNILPLNPENYLPYKGGEKYLVGFFKTEEEIENFLGKLSRLKTQAG